MFKATFSNISAISWRPVLVVEEAGAPQRKKNNHGQATGKLAAASRVHPYCNLQSRAQTQFYYVLVQTSHGLHSFVEAVVVVIVKVALNTINQPTLFCMLYINTLHIVNYPQLITF